VKPDGVDVVFPQHIWRGRIKFPGQIEALRYIRRGDQVFGSSQVYVEHTLPSGFLQLREDGSWVRGNKLCKRDGLKLQLPELERHVWQSG